MWSARLDTAAKGRLISHSLVPLSMQCCTDVHTHLYTLRRKKERERWREKGRERERFHPNTLRGKKREERKMVRKRMSERERQFTHIHTRGKK